MNDAQTIQDISNFLHAASRLKGCGLTLVKIASRRQELPTRTVHLFEPYSNYSSTSSICIKCRIKSRTQGLAV